MPAYKTKPQIKYAEQFHDDGRPDPPGVIRDRMNHPLVQTIHGHTLPIKKGEYIVQEATDTTKFYPVQPDIFEANHELIPDSV